MAVQSRCELVPSLTLFCMNSVFKVNFLKIYTKKSRIDLLPHQSCIWEFFNCLWPPKARTIVTFCYCSLMYGGSSAPILIFWEINFSYLTAATWERGTCQKFISTAELILFLRLHTTCQSGDKIFSCLPICSRGVFSHGRCMGKERGGGMSNPTALFSRLF